MMFFEFCGDPIFHHIAQSSSDFFDIFDDNTSNSLEVRSGSQFLPYNLQEILDRLVLSFDLIG